MRVSIKSAWRGLALLVVASCVSSVFADDWPQWRGPNRDGISKEKGLLNKWPAAGPKLAWTYKDAGEGLSSFAIVKDRLYTMGVRDKVEHVICLDVGKGNGKEVWTSKIDKPYTFKGNTWNECPLGTPTVDGDMVYALGSQGVFVGVGTDGKENWRKDLFKDFGGTVSEVPASPPPLGWGYASSPLVDDDKVIVVPGGKKGLLAAFDKKSGKFAWQSSDVAEVATYSSPILVTIEKVKQVICMTQNGVVGVDAATGKLLWEYKQPAPYSDTVVPTPIYHDGLLFTTARDGPCDGIEINFAGGKFAAKSVWSNNKLQNWQGGVVLIDGHLYGYHETNRWVCLDFKTGAEKWQSPRRALPVGSIIAAEDLIFCVTEKKDVMALFKASPEGYKELSVADLPPASKLRKPSGQMWTHPVIVNGRLYVRDQEFVYCYEVK